MTAEELARSALMGIEALTARYPFDPYRQKEDAFAIILEALRAEYARGYAAGQAARSRTPAHAALRAIREPSPVVVEAMVRAVLDRGADDFPNRPGSVVTMSARINAEEAKRIWRAAVDAITGEGG